MRAIAGGFPNGWWVIIRIKEMAAKGKSISQF